MVSMAGVKCGMINIIVVVKRLGRRNGVSGKKSIPKGHIPQTSRKDIPFE